jgi:hypothetical protein
MKDAFEERLDSFFDLFTSTLELAERLIASRSHAQELLILLCSRLDALASSAVAEDSPRKQAFTHFITAYGCRRNLFESISAGDLYFDLAYHRWMLPGTIPKPGRIHRYSRIDDPIIDLLQDSGIALTEKDAERLLNRIMKALRGALHVMPRQPLTKPPIASMGQVIEIIVDSFDTPRKKSIADALPKALRSLVYSKTMAAILYEKFRCEAIHGAKVLMNEHKFFVELEPYWEPEESGYFGSYFLAEFPARFLVCVLRDCITTYRQHLVAKGKLPPDILFHVFGDDSFKFIELLDEDALAKDQTLRLRASQ